MLERIYVALGGFLDEIAVKDLPAALLVKQPLGADLTSVVQPVRNSARQATDGCSGQGGERGDDGGIHRCSPQPAIAMTRTTAALRKSAASFVAPIHKTRTIAFGRGTGFGAVAAR